MTAPPSPRNRRLRADREALERLAGESTIISFEGPGAAPERYALSFRGSGLERGVDGRVVVRREHRIEVTLGPEYPRQRPDLRVTTPVFHPNVAAGGAVCLGGYSTHWAPGLTMDAMCAMLWDMIRYANYDVRSPYNLEAARWASAQREYRFPLDPRPLRDRVAAARAAPSALLAEPSPPPDIVFRG
ncbi:MAG: ubiquitin-conjugating enzyme E2 [Planctomycetales bacterium]|nr:ubiquitin-conjugating enzyme E2 [Planctomycetales bacterium]